MKRLITNILILLCCCSLYGQSTEGILDKKISLSIENQSLDLVLKEIEKLGDFSFAYSSEIFDINRLVSIDVQEQSIQTVLDQVFKNRGIECREMANKVLIRKRKTTNQVKPQPTVKSKDQANRNTKIKTLPPSETREQKPDHKKSNSIKAGRENRDMKPVVSVSDKSEMPVNQQSTVLNPEHKMLIKSNRLNLEDMQVSVRPNFVQPELLGVKSQVYLAEPDIQESEVKEPKAKKDKEPFKLRGYAASSTGFGRVGDRLGIIMGGRLVWMMKPNIGIGLVGYAFETSKERDNVLALDDYRFSGGYGGILLEYTLNPNRPFHLSFPLTIAGGGSAYARRTVDTEKVTEDSQGIFVLEPGVDLELNIIKYVRVAFGIAYRYSTDTQLTYQNNGNEILSVSGLNGLTGKLTIKVGIF